MRMGLCLGIPMLFLTACEDKKKKQATSISIPAPTQNQSKDSANVVVEETTVIVVTDSIRADSSSKSKK